VTVLAHSGHRLVSLAYLLPLVGLMGIVFVGWLKDRRSQSGAQESSRNSTVGPPGANKEE